MPPVFFPVFLPVRYLMRSGFFYKNPVHPVVLPRLILPHIDRYPLLHPTHTAVRYPQKFVRSVLLSPAPLPLVHKMFPHIFRFPVLFH